MKIKWPAARAGFLLLFAVLSLASVAAGCAIAAANGAPAGVWLRDVIAWGLGGLAAAGLALWAGHRMLVGAVVAAPLALVCGLLGAGQQGVHRWVDLGPVHMNVASLLLPPAVVAWGASAGGPRWPWIAAALTLGLLIIQPDASQATALGGALAAVMVLGPGRAIARCGGVLLVAAAVIAAWLRIDPLAPVPDVEGIMGLAWRLSPVAAVAAWIALAGAALSPMVLGLVEDGSVGPAAAALTAYAILSVLTPLFGAFPVPLVGMGMSPILGLWLGAGLLAALAHRRDRLASP